MTLGRHQLKAETRPTLAVQHRAGKGQCEHSWQLYWKAAADLPVHPAGANATLSTVFAKPDEALKRDVASLCIEWCMNRFGAASSHRSSASHLALLVGCTSFSASKLVTRQ